MNLAQDLTRWAEPGLPSRERAAAWAPTTVLPRDGERRDLGKTRAIRMITAIGELGKVRGTVEVFGLARMVPDIDGSPQLHDRSKSCGSVGM